MRVYLCGGMRTEWREYVKTHISGPFWLDPTKHGLDRPGEYTVWDLTAVRQSDVVFAYMAVDNPSGVGLALEVGYAIALGKPVILVDESTNKYMDIVQRAASLSYPTLAEGMVMLSSLIGIMA